MDIYAHGNWISLVAAEPVRNFSLCSKNNNTVRNIKNLTDYNNQLVIINQVVPIDREKEDLIDKGECVRCIEVTVSVKTIFKDVSSYKLGFNSLDAGMDKTAQVVTEQEMEKLLRKVVRKINNKGD